MSKSSEEAPTQEGAAGAAAAAGQKDANNIYENRAGTKKIVRVVTVMAYVFSVSFAAILLSAYYVFLWEPPNPKTIQRHPLLGEPQAEYLIDNNNLITNKEFVKTSDDRKTIFDTNYSNPIKNFEVITSGENEDIIEDDENNSQKLLAYEDFLKLIYREKSTTPLTTTTTTTTTTTDSSILLTAMMPTIKSIVETANNKSSRFLNKEGKFLLRENLNIPIKRSQNVSKEQENYYGVREEDLVKEETTTVFNEADNISSTTSNNGDFGTTVLSTTDDYSSDEIMVEKFDDNNVTIEDYGTTDASTSQIPVVISELETNYETSLRKERDSTDLSLHDVENGEDDRADLTTIPELGIYAVESSQVISKKLKKKSSSSSL